MRDIIVTLIVFGLIPLVLKKPYIGVMLWSWLGYMNPHRLTWGFAYSMPFSAITAVAIFIGMVFSKEKKSFPWNRVTIIWLLFIIWTLVTYMFALEKAYAIVELNRWVKIQALIACTLLLINNKERLIMLVWVIVVSIGFYGFKGGIFSLATGFSYQVRGPADSFFGGNNEMALTLLMVIPLMYFLFTITKQKIVKYGLLAAIFLSFFSVVSSYSRGAFLAAFVMLFFLWLGTKRKILTGSIIAIVIIAGMPFIPEKWYDRMETIQTYEEDQSALGRINAWYFAYNLANDRPLVGGGFRVASPALFQIYAPNPDDFHDFHSIYFEMLGEQGYVGLFLFLMLWILVLREARKIKKMVKGNPELQWMKDLVMMIQVGLIAYLSGGAFLGLAYFDLPYHYMSIMVLTGVLCRKSIKVENINDTNHDISHTR